jgi:hypothetical protein
MDGQGNAYAVGTPQRSNSLKSNIEFAYTPETPTNKLCDQLEAFQLKTPAASAVYLPTPQSDLYVLTLLVAQSVNQNIDEQDCFKSSLLGNCFVHRYTE